MGGSHTVFHLCPSLMQVVLLVMVDASRCASPVDCAIVIYVHAMVVTPWHPIRRPVLHKVHWLLCTLVFYYCRHPDFDSSEAILLLRVQLSNYDVGRLSTTSLLVWSRSYAWCLCSSLYPHTSHFHMLAFVFPFVTEISATLLFGSSRYLRRIQADGTNFTTVAFGGELFSSFHSCDIDTETGTVFFALGKFSSTATTRIGKVCTENYSCGGVMCILSGWQVACPYRIAYSSLTFLQAGSALVFTSPSTVC